MVRLRRRRGLFLPPKATRFQSHYGAIATIKFLKGPVYLLMFQSHYGAIATSFVIPIKFGLILSFNPTMVRLRQKAAQMLSRLPQGFNPTMVRLRLTLRITPNEATVTGFNPTMVRLRQNRESRKSPKGRRFNPTMVRLRPKGLPAWAAVGSPFQSHYGAIATR